MCLKVARLITLENWVLRLSSELVQQNQWQHKLAAVTLKWLVLAELWGQPGSASLQHPGDGRAAGPAGWAALSPPNPFQSSSCPSSWGQASGCSSQLGHRPQMAILNEKPSWCTSNLLTPGVFYLMHKLPVTWQSQSHSNLSCQAFRH